jgi:hypothetical protein
MRAGTIDEQSQDARRCCVFCRFVTLRARNSLLCSVYKNVVDNGVQSSHPDACQEFHFTVCLYFAPISNFTWLPDDARVFHRLSCLAISTGQWVVKYFFYSHGCNAAYFQFNIDA